MILWCFFLIFLFGSILKTIGYWWVPARKSKPVFFPGMSSMWQGLLVQHSAASVWYTAMDQHSHGPTQHFLISCSNPSRNWRLRKAHSDIALSQVACNSGPCSLQALEFALLSCVLDALFCNLKSWVSVS